MSAGQGRRSGIQIIAGVHTRLSPFDAHVGTRADALRRYERAAGTAARGSSVERTAFAASMFPWMVDHRNLMQSIHHVVSAGPKAPGPNGVRIEELGFDEQWQVTRVLSDAIRTNRYRQGPTRSVEIPKASGIGTRTLQLLNAEDKIVHRAVAQTISPFVDPQFDEESYGFRPYRGREDALISLERLVHADGVSYVISEDLANAFDQVPVRRLLNVVCMYGLPEAVRNTIANCIGERRRGIPQGSPLSPLLLNLYLDYLLDRRWRKRYPRIQLLRSADDLLFVCRSESEAKEAYRSLARMVGDMGMKLKGSPLTTICRTDTEFEWLGFRLTILNGSLIACISPRSWSRLSAHLMGCHTLPEPSLRAWETILAWIAQLGPCLPNEDVGEIYRGVVEAADRSGFTEIPSRDLFVGHWECAHARFLSLRNVKLRQVQVAVSGISSARRHPSTLNGRDCGGSLCESPQSSFHYESRFIVHTDGSFLPGGRGGWAFSIETSNGIRLPGGSGSTRRTTNNKMELIAVIQALRNFSAPSDIKIVTDSRYVADGIKSAVEEWSRNNWRRRGGGLVANQELWAELVELIQPHRVEFEWVRGHSGNQRNEECDRLSRAAAEFVIGETSDSPPGAFS